MTAAIPLFKKDSNNNPILERTEYDNNSFADMNKLQEQIGDLNNFNTNFGDLDNNLNSNVDITTFFNYIKNKILNNADNDITKKSKIKQNGYDLLPEGLIIFIAGTDVNKENNANGSLAGLNNCPPGYIECNNQNIIDSLNSVFNNLTNRSPDLRGHFIRGEGIGVNNNNLLNISIGNIDGSNNHLHNITHAHEFTHEHAHTHESNHRHNLDHYHNFSTNVDNFGEINHAHYAIPYLHRHRIKGKTKTDNSSNFNTSPNVYDATSDDDSHYHEFDIYTDYNTTIDTKGVKTTLTDDELYVHYISNGVIHASGSLVHNLKTGDELIYNGVEVKILYTTTGAFGPNSRTVHTFPYLPDITPGGLPIKFKDTTEGMNNNINSSIPNSTTVSNTINYSTSPVNTDDYTGNSENADMFPRSKKVKFCMKI